MLAPDLIALQEVDAGPGRSNQAEELFGPLGYAIAYEHRDGEYRADPGIAVPSRLPLIGRQVTPDWGLRIQPVVPTESTIHPGWSSARMAPPTSSALLATDRLGRTSV